MAAVDNVVLALSADHVVRLSGLTHRQLTYWDSIGFFKPEYAAENRRAPNSRIYSFQDAVGLRTISVLMNHYGVSLPHLKDVATKLTAETTRPWSQLKLRVWNRRVQIEEPETGAVRDVLQGQYVLLPIIDVIHQVEAGIEQLKARDPLTIGKFERNRYISHNKTMISGTRVPVATIFEYIEDGFAVDEILKNFPSLTVADIEAVRKMDKASIAA